MLNFLNDAWQLLRLRLKPVAEYRYPGFVVVAILLVLGVVNAQAFMPILGLDQNGTVAVSLAFTVLNWAVFSQTMRLYFRWRGAPDLPLAHFVLLTQALMIPAMAFPYLPAGIAVVLSLVWQFWTLWVQIHGFARFSQLSGLKILLGYVLYVVTLVVASTVLMLALISIGVLDANVIVENVEAMQQAVEP
ncbi:MAG: hypothetical protein KBC57_11195 [Neisseriaceae bacterium]|nr:hypothetical protein [Neisseriaceae bacterium]